MKTSELTGAALDWAVAKCEGYEIVRMRGSEITFLDRTDDGALNEKQIGYSTNWAEGGPIIEHEGMGMWMYQWNEQGEAEQGWYAEDKDGDHVQTGLTPLIAAMRCYVASKLGDNIDIPKELQ